MRRADLIAADLEAASERRVMGLLSPHAELMREAAEALRAGPAVSWTSVWTPDERSTTTITTSGGTYEAVPVDKPRKPRQKGK